MARDKMAARERVGRLERIKQAREQGDVPHLVSALRDPDWRQQAARYLGELGATEAVEPLIEQLQTWKPSSQIAAVQALGKLGAKQAAPTLLELAHTSENPLTRAWAASALVDVGSPDAFDAAVPLLRDPSPMARGLAVEALGRLGDSRALQPLRETRPRLLSFLEWWWLQGGYRRAIATVRRRAGGKRSWMWSYAPWFMRARTLSWLLFWAAVYVSIGLVVGFWWALLPVAVVQVAGIFLALLSMRGHWAELD